MKESKAHITLRTRVSLACRKKRMSEFEDFYFKNMLSSNASGKNVTVLDLGGTVSYWQSMDFKYFNTADFMILNLNKTDVPDTYENVRSIAGDATNLSEYADKQFDLVFSNSVIEHVGNYEKQKRMAAEMQRVGVHYYLQTPNKWFFMEPHFMLPFFQLLPLYLKAFLIRFFKVGRKHAKGMGFDSDDGWGDNWEQSVKIAGCVRLLTLKELKQLFPNAIIRKEKFLFMTKSFYLFSKLNLEIVFSERVNSQSDFSCYYLCLCFAHFERSKNRAGVLWASLIWHLSLPECRERREKRMNIALLTAAGNGTRMGQDIPKQFMPIDNKPLIIHTMEKFQSHPAIDAILVVTLPAWIEVLKTYAVQFNITKLKWIVQGGATNQESIYNGLMELQSHCAPNDVVMVHDGNRCMVADEIISDSLSVFQKYGSAVAAIPCVEAVFLSEDGQTASSFVPRERLIRTQTPHTYTLEKLLWAHGEAEKRGITNTTASCTLMSELGEKVYFSKGSEENLKLTTTEDVRIFRALLRISAAKTR